MEYSGNSKGGLITAGGILSIVAGIFQINNGAILVAFFLTQAESLRKVIPSWWFIPSLLPGFWAEYWGFFDFAYGTQVWLRIVGVLFLSLGIVAVIGGISAVRRKRFGLSLAGAIAALGSGLLGIVAVISVALGKREFRAKVKEDGN
jgi:hypothetical protein